MNRESKVAVAVVALVVALATLAWGTRASRAAEVREAVSVRPLPHHVHSIADLFPR
jgi:hypothetical protein